MNIKKALKYILSATFAVALLWFSFRDVEWATFMEELKSCNWQFIALSMAAGTNMCFLIAQGHISLR